MILLHKKVKTEDTDATKQAQVKSHNVKRTARTTKIKKDETTTHKEIHRNTTLKRLDNTTSHKTEGDVMCSGKGMQLVSPCNWALSMSCSACGTRRVAKKSVKVGGKTKLAVENVS